METIISTDKDIQLYSVEEISQFNKKSEQYVRGLLRKGKIKGNKIGNSWVVYEKKLIEKKTKSKSNIVEDRIRCSKIVPEIIALSFFSGAMGLDIGLSKEGIPVILASEIDNKCRNTIILNEPDIGLIGDIRNYDAKSIRKHAGLPAGKEIDLIVGGPPCQAFSTAGKRQGFNDERGNVFLTFIDRILELKPKYAVIENVRGLLSAPLSHRPHNKRVGANKKSLLKEQKGGALHYIIDKLEKGGYSVSFNLYNAANFGAPQKRERVVLICARDGKTTPFLEPTHSMEGKHNLPKWKSFKDAIARINENNKHEHVNFPEKRLRYYRMLKPGQNWKNLPTSIQKQALGASYYSGGGKTGFLRRLSWSDPSPTLVTHPAMPATDLAHPVEDRPLSVDEYLCIQEFPESWIISGKAIDKYKQIGNAVPISLGRAIGRLINKLLKNEMVNEVKGFRYSRYLNTDTLSWKKEFYKRIQLKPKD